MDITHQHPLNPINPADLEPAPTIDYEMPVIEPESAAVTQTMPQIAISLEVVIYVVLILFSLTLRFAELGTYPLNDAQAHEALAAFRAIEPRAAGLPLIANNPLMFTANSLIMSLAGSDTATPKIPTVILGALLVIAPLLLRRWLGAANALVLAGLLTISPVLFAASRSMSGVVWSMALAVFGVYLIGKFIETRRASYAVTASSVLLMLALMAEPAGLLTLISLGFGVAFALATVDDPDHYYRRVFSETVGAWPWLRSAGIAAASVVIVSTVFLLYPQGLGTLGNALDQLWRGMAFRPQGQPLAFPLLSSLLHEPVFWFFGLVGAYLAMRGEANFLQRGLVGWLITAIIWSFIYHGGDGTYALWFTIPLAGLSAITVERILTPVQDRFWQVPVWGPWIHGIAVVAMLAIAGINLLAVAQSLLNTDPSMMPQLGRPMQLVMIGPAVLLVVITFFLVGSTWGTRAAWHGIGIGLLVFFGLYSMSVGWRGVIVNGDDPREFWQLHTATRELNLMDTTLKTASLRSTGMPYDMQLVVHTPVGTRGDDGSLAWAVHRYFHTEFVNELSPTITAPVVITPVTAENKPQLGASYVGQDFPVYYSWDSGTLSWDTLIWLYDRRTRVKPEGTSRVITWVRSDVYGVSGIDNVPVPSAQ